MVIDCAIIINRRTSGHISFVRGPGEIISPGGGPGAAPPAEPAPDFGDPVAPPGADPANPVGETRVIVEPDLPRGVNYAVMRPWRPVQDTIVYNQGIMIDSLAQAIINRRLEARARGGGSFLFAQVNQEKLNRSTDTSSTPSSLSALTLVRRTGFAPRPLPPGIFQKSAGDWIESIA